MSNSRITRSYSLVIIFLVILCSGFYSQYSSGYGSMYPFLIHQVVIVCAIGIPVFIITIVIDKQLYFKYAYVFFAITVVLILLVFLTGKSSMGATRWIKFMGINMQPAEFLKISTIFMFARYFSKFTQEDLKNPFFLALPVLSLIFPLYLVLRQPSLGTFLLIVALTLSIYFIIGVSLKYFFVLFISLLISIPLVWHYGLYEYQKTRILTFIKPEESSRDANYNILQSKIAIGSGGLHGRGLISGAQTQLRFLPERHTDFVFAVVAEELGFAFVLFLIFLYLAFYLVGLYISISSQSMFDKILCFGISMLVFLQCMINLAMISGLAPVVGMPLPIMSYGGSTMIANILNLGILLKINNTANMT